MLICAPNSTSIVFSMLRGTFLLLICALLVSFTLSFKCTNDEDCSLNGQCDVSTGVCHCDSGWKNFDCNVLDLAPATYGQGYNRTNEGISSWGGRIMRDPDNPKLHHLIAAEFTNGCGLDYWSPMSRIIRAESTVGPAGPYKFANEIVPTFAHNPQVVWSEKDQQYLMFHIGCSHPVKPTGCESPSFTCDPGNYLNGESGISIKSAKKLTDDKWVDYGIVLGANKNGTWDTDTTNPSPFALEDGTIVLAYRGCPFNCGGDELINIAYASNFTGPYTRMQSQPIFPEGNEDPFIWRDRRGSWHMLLHSLEANGGFGGPMIGRHAFSRNGKSWTFNNATDSLTYNTTVHFTDGSVVDFNRRERPQLHFDEHGVPTYLVNGVQEKNSGMSYTFIQPLWVRSQHSAETVIAAE